MKKIVVGAVVVACVAAVGLLYASPHIALYNIGKAIERKDADAVSEYVDFPALRENVKGVLLAKMQSEMDKPEMKDNPFAGLGQILHFPDIGPVVLYNSTGFQPINNPVKLHLLKPL